MQCSPLSKLLLCFIGETLVVKRESHLVNSNELYDEFTANSQDEINEALLILEYNDLISLSKDNYDLHLTGKGIVKYRQYTDTLKKAANDT